MSERKGLPFLGVLRERHYENPAAQEQLSALSVCVTQTVNGFGWQVAGLGAILDFSQHIGANTLDTFSNFK